MITNEQWRPVPGFPDYRVSSSGRVASDKKPTPIVLRPSYSHNGYQQVGLQRDRVGNSFKVHYLVALAFIGPRPDGMEIRHLDGDKTNNSVTNIAYGTRSENIQDQVKHGAHVNVKKTHCPSGHAFDEINTYHWRGHRKCRICMRAAARAYAERRAFAAANVSERAA